MRGDGIRDAAANHAAHRAKEKGLAGIVFYDQGKIGEAVDLREHSVPELAAQVKRAAQSAFGRKSFEELDATAEAPPESPETKGAETLCKPLKFGLSR